MSKNLSVNKFIWIPLIIVLLLMTIFLVIQRRSKQAMISEFGKYQGYSKEAYNGSKRISDYLTLTEGTRLAYDVILPTKNGAPAAEPLPALFIYTPYGRSWTIFDKNGKFLLSDIVDLSFPIRAVLRVRYWLSGDRGRIMDPLFRNRWLNALVRHGYAIVAVDRPGTGASFASPTPGSMETAASFENEIIDWIAAQPWSDGKVGMYGESQQAMVQFAAASTGNLHLKAILPAASDIEIYNSVEYPGGIFNKAFASVYAIVPLLDNLATPVDSDPEGVLLAQARESRKNTVGIQSASEMAAQAPYHDSLTPSGINPWQIMDLYPFIDRINRSQTAVYMTVGWYDIFTADMFYWFENLTVPKRLTVRPTDHSQVSADLRDLSYGIEAMRWFDYWLKGINNGVMDEPPIHYYLQEGIKKGLWQTSDRWPLASQKMIPYYFSPGKSGSVSSINDGFLDPNPMASPSASDAYTVDYSTTTGAKSRWSSVEQAHQYPDLSQRDAKALTYTTLPLVNNLVVTGYPVVHLWLTTSAPDLDVFVYLEEVDSSGKAVYVAEGDLRATHRKLSPAPFYNLGLPYHSHNQSDLEALPAGMPFEMVFSLLPTSYQFAAGSRIRLTVAFTDAGNFDTPVLDPPPTLQLLRDADHASNIALPVVQNP